jgi:hypothetical protein
MPRATAAPYAATPVGPKLPAHHGRFVEDLPEVAISNHQDHADGRLTRAAA